MCYMSGVHYVFDTGFSRTFSLLESQREFLERFARKEEDKKALPMLASACPGNKYFLCPYTLYTMYAMLKAHDILLPCLQRLDMVITGKNKIYFSNAITGSEYLTKLLSDEGHKYKR